MVDASILSLGQRVFDAELTETRGAILCALMLLMWAVLSHAARARLVPAVSHRYERAAPVWAWLIGIAGLVYLFYPNYFDHVESTISTLGKVLRSHEPLYPVGDRYPFYGVLYGPAVGLTQLAFGKLGIPILIGSKLPGLIAYGLSVWILFCACKTSQARAYLLFLFPGAFELMTNMGGVLILLLVSITIGLRSRIRSPIAVAALCGGLAGLASAAKMHGALYVLAAYLAAPGVSFISLAVFAAAAPLTFALCFAPPGIDFDAFVQYLRLAAQHGLAPKWFGRNLLYLLYLLSPLAILLHRGVRSFEFNARLLSVLVLDLAVAVIAAKPGAGTHHLLLLVPIHAFIIEQIAHADRSVYEANLLKVVYASVVIAAVVVLSVSLYTIGSRWNLYGKATREVLLYKQRYPGLTMAVSDDGNYDLSFLRVLLDGPQIDYPGYMDLKFSGVSDQPLVEQMNRCNLRYLLMPGGGEPFSNGAFYTATQLFSDGTRRAFASHYGAIEKGAIYTVYACELRR